jgi:chemotaxis protein methyltransferase CheR
MSSASGSVKAPRAAIQKMAKLALELTGVQLSERHTDMIDSRFQKRLVDLGLKDLDAYLEYFEAHRADETPKLVSLLTTHHTYFFREFAHFEFLLNQALPALAPEVLARPDKKLRIWSAACSRGQEAYSLAMFLELHIKRIAPGMQYEIFGTDVDPESVEIAKNGVYLRNDLKEVPLSLLGDHWSRGTGDIAQYVKAKSSLRGKCKFQVGNLLGDLGPVTPESRYDLIFCRNVFIYFKEDQIKKISTDLMARLQPKGLFFIGLSESLTQLKLPIQSLGPSVYQHRVEAKKSALVSTAAQKKGSAAPAPIPPVTVAPVQTGPIRVLCVDDSPSILALLKKLLTKENGFEIVGTAMNGIEAHKKVSELKPDALTLDIHMPEMTGIEYLKKHYGPGHPPVVMVTSVSRENAELAGEALASGASDYVEKPALTNLAERGDEIRTKLRCAMLSQVQSTTKSLSLDREFQAHAAAVSADQSLRVVVLSLSHRKKLKSLLAEFATAHAPTILLVEGSAGALSGMGSILSKETGKTITFCEQTPDQLGKDSIYLMDLATQVGPVWDKFGANRKVSVMVFGDLSAGSSQKLLKYEGAQLILEDIGGGKGTKNLMDVASDVVLATSFAYLSSEFLAAGSEGRKKAA